MLKTIIIIICLALFISCADSNKDCILIGNWESSAFVSDKAVDMNKDGKFHTDLLKEDDCSKVILKFNSNGTVERFSRNRKTKCKLSKSTMDYVVNGDEITFTVVRMKQKHKFEIEGCLLKIYRIHESGMTKTGRKDLSITAIFEKQ